MMTRRVLPLSLALLGLLPATALGAAQVELRPAAGAAGSSLTLHGTGFKARRSVAVTVTGRHARRVRADRDGAFTFTTTAPGGHRVLSIASRSGDVRVGNRFSVTSAAGAGTVLEVGSAGGQRVRVSPLTLLPGGTLQLAGSGFRARQRLSVSGLGFSARIRAARTGRFTTALVLPATLRNGASTLSISGSGVKLRLRLARATAAPVPPAGGALGVVVASPVAPPAVAPASTGAPAISGTAKVGQALTATAGGWSGTAPMALSFQWERCTASGAACTDIAGATAATYAPADADAGGKLRVVVTAANAAGSADATSALTATVTAAPRNTALPVVGGTPQEGKTLTAGGDAWSGYPSPGADDRKYQWLRCSGTKGACTSVSGKTAKTYAVGSADVGKTLAVRVTMTTSAGSASADSIRTGTVVAAPPPTGVAALWHMDELSGNTMVDSAGSHNGTLSSGVTPGVVGGFTGTAYAFNGVNGNVRVPAADLNPLASDVTVSLRMKTPYLAPSSVEDWDLFKKGSYYGPNGQAQPEIKMEYYPSGQASCGWAGADAQGNLTFYEIKNVGPVLNDDLWHTIQCVKTATSVKLVVDGATIKAKDIAIGSISNADDIVIGSHSSGTEWFRGLIDEVSIAYG